jgi:hypothetical protein
VTLSSLPLDTPMDRAGAPMQRCLPHPKEETSMRIVLGLIVALVVGVATVPATARIPDVPPTVQETVCSHVPYQTPVPFCRWEVPGH